jgi:hypothetical protein
MWAFVLEKHTSVFKALNEPLRAVTRITQLGAFAWHFNPTHSPDLHAFDGLVKSPYGLRGQACLNVLLSLQ